MNFRNQLITPIILIDLDNYICIISKCKFFYIEYLVAFLFKK